MSARKLSALLSLAAGLIVMTPNMVIAQDASGAPSTPGATQGRDPLAVYQAVGASPDQMTTIKGHVDTFNNGQSQRGKALWSLMRDMHQLSLQPSPDENAVLSKQNEINQTGAAMATEKMKLMLKIRSVLTPDQRAKLVQLMQPKGQAPQVVPGQ
jgi:Spy/CpxP family protein refolding chaperone